MADKASMKAYVPRPKSKKPKKSAPKAKKGNPGRAARTPGLNPGGSKMSAY